VNWTFDEKRIAPFFGSQNDLEEIERLVNNCLTVLDEGASVRQMVLETWLTVDYSVRQLLLSGFEVRRFSGGDLELEYDLLPGGYEERLPLLEKVVGRNRSLPPEPPGTDRTGGFKASWEYWRFIRESCPDLIAQMEAAQREFAAQQNPGLAAHIREGGGYCVAEAPEDVGRMNPGWVEVADDLDEDWFASARLLNKARNKAAHSIRPEAIADKFGLHGPNIVLLTKEKCLLLLQTLMRVEYSGTDD
jgi:hypothetical protein